MTWWTSLAASATPQVLAPSTAGLLVVDAAAGPITAILPSVLTGQPIYVTRRDAAGNNAVSFAPAGQDVIVPASPASPDMLIWPGDAFVLMPLPPNRWMRLESGLGVLIREATVAALVAFGTIAGTAVESERLDGIASGDTPRLVVFADEDADGTGNGGTAPAFDATLHLIVQALVERSGRADAVGDLDLLLMQTRDALLGDPMWPTLAGSIHSMAITREFKPRGDLIVGEGRIKFALAWTEIYRPRITQPLATVTLTTTPPAGTTPIAAGGAL